MGLPDKFIIFFFCIYIYFSVVCLFVYMSICKQTDMSICVVYTCWNHRYKLKYKNWMMWSIWKHIVWMLFIHGLPVVWCCFISLLNQVLESDLKKKIAHAQEVYNQAKHTLTYFSFQKQRLEDLISQMAERLVAVEGSLSDLTEATSPEDMGTVKVWHYHFPQCDTRTH